MRKFTFKSLLIAAALCLGTSAWAEETTVLYERGTTTAWSDADLTEWTASVEGPTSSINSGLAVTVPGKGKAGHYSKSISPVSNTSILRLTATWNPGNATGTQNNTNAYLSFGDVQFAFYGSSWYTNVTIGGVTTKLGAGYTRSRDYSIVVTINQATNEVTYSFTDNGNTVTGKGTTASAGSFTTLSHGLGGKVPNWGNTTTLKTIEITEEPQTVTTANYTINYILGGGIIKTVQAKALTRTVITAEKSFYDSNGVKYYVDEDPLPTMTISEKEEDNVLNVNVREAETWNYTVMSSVGNYKVTDGTAIEGENVSVAFPRLINVDGTLYTSNTAGNKECLYTFNMDAADKVATINFTATDITGVVFFSEAENIEGLTADNGGQAGSRNSMKQGAFAAEDTEIVTLQAGKYKISGARSGNSGVTFAFVVNGATVSQATTSGSWGTFGGAEFNLVEEATIVLKAAGQGGNNSKTLDYIYIQKTGDATTAPQSVTVGTNGIATFTPSVALDFTNATNIKAYTATVSETTVTLTETKTVAAGEGVIIKSVNGGEAQETIAVANPATATEGNALVGTLVDIDPLATTDGTYNNYILNVVEGKVGFYQANNKKVAAGKAYLQVPVTNGAKALTIVWNDGETTGIEENYEFGTMNSDAATFDLSGRKVANPAKGLYIKNGKKFIVK